MMRYNLGDLLHTGAQYEAEDRLNHWRLDGGLALSILRDLRAARACAEAQAIALSKIENRIATAFDEPPTRAMADIRKILDDARRALRGEP